MRPVVLVLAFAAGCQSATCEEDEKQAFFVDVDGDGFGGVEPVRACATPIGAVALGTDCDDADATVHPTAGETCNDVDDDCDGVIDGANAVGQRPFYPDGDGDGYGFANAPAVACSTPAGFVDLVGDCDDADPARNPAAEDACDDVDNDCNGVVDDGPQPTWAVDADGDGHGNPKYTTRSCDPIDGWVTAADDCDDTDGAVFPGATEICNDRDDDCDGETDPATSADALPWYADGDGDGVAPDDAAVILACDTPAGATATRGDCDDANADVFPGNAEVCDGVDNDCDAEIDWGLAVPAAVGALSTALARAADGDTICLAAGTYGGTFDAEGKSLTLEGIGPDDTFLDGRGKGRVFSVTNGETLTLRGLTVQNGASNQGAALYVTGSAVIAEDVVFSANAVTPSASGATASGYAPIYVSLSDVAFEDVDIVDHAVDADLSGLTLSGTSVAHYQYGGLVYASGSTLTWERGTIADNTVAPTHDGRTATGSGTTAVYGGVLYASGSTIALDGVDITDDTIAPEAAATSTGTATVYAYGGVFYASASEIDLTGLAVSGLSMTPSAAGASLGTAGAYGALFYAASTRLGVEDVDVTDVIVTATPGTTGGSYAWGLWYGTGTASWTSTTLSGNTLSATASTSYTAQAALAYWNGTTSTDALTLQENTTSTADTSSTAKGSGYCYGLYLYHASSTLDLSRLWLIDNTATCEATYSYAYPLLMQYYGYSGGGATLTNAIIAGNTIESAYYAYYGLVYSSYTTATITNTVIADNTVRAKYLNSSGAATQVYGVLYADYQGNHEIVNASIDNNTFTSSTATTVLGGALVSAYAPSAGYASLSSEYSNWYDNSGSAVWYYRNTGGQADPEGSDGNLAEDPRYTDAAGRDYTLKSTSLLVDAGAPSILDGDGTVSDIGAFGGPGG